MITRLILLSLLGILAAFGEATEERVWTSTANTQITAKAISLNDSTVTFETNEGRELKVPLAKLVTEDQTTLKKHFLSRLQPAPPSQIPAQVKAAEYELGKMLGPIEAEAGSSYYLYLPSTMAEGTEAPVLFWTGAGRSNDKTLKRFIKASELTGMVLAASVESKNQSNAFQINNGHTVNCLNKLEDTLPVSFQRLFFSGNSGGGATAFYNADKIKCAGALPYIGYMPSGQVPNNGDYFYIGTGATDFNRYLSAHAANQLKDKAIHRLYPGQHSTGNEEISTEGVLWLYTRELYDNPDKRMDEIARFEVRFHKYLTEELADKPHLAYFWTDHLLNTCKMASSSKGVFTLLHEKLAAVSENQRYLKARVSLSEFSQEHYAKIGSKGGSKSEHTTPQISAAAEALLAEFPDLVEMSDIFKEIGEPTVKIR